MWGRRTGAAAAVCAALLALLALAGCGPGAITQENRTERFTVRLTLDAATMGARTLTIDITDRSGQPAAADEVTIAPVMRQMGMAEPEVAARLVGPGRYEARAELFSMLGEWQIEVRIVAGGQEDRTSFTVEVT